MKAEEQYKKVDIKGIVKYTLSKRQRNMMNGKQPRLTPNFILKLLIKHKP